jgi:DNA-binding response OmpR family regulator
MVILLLDDNIRIQFLTWKWLKADGFTVLTAGDGETALEISRNYPGVIDLLLTEMEMPRMSGLQLCRIIATERPATRVLVMSDDLQVCEQASAGGLPVLRKPFTSTGLRDSLEVILGPIPLCSNG